MKAIPLFILLAYLVPVKEGVMSHLNGELARLDSPPRPRATPCEQQALLPT